MQKTPGCDLKQYSGLDQVEVFLRSSVSFLSEGSRKHWIHSVIRSYLAVTVRKCPNLLLFDSTPTDFGGNGVRKVQICLILCKRTRDIFNKTTRTRVHHSPRALVHSCCFLYPIHVVTDGLTWLVNFPSSKRVCRPVKAMPYSVLPRQ